MSGGLTYRAYRAASQTLSLAAKPYLKRRAGKGKEDEARLSERFGQASLPRPDGALVWIHAASVGESVMMLPLAGRLTENGASVLVTTGTVTSAQMMDAKLPKGAVHQYVPLDAPKYVTRFLDHWTPELALWAESEIWPNLLSETTARNIPAILVNARMSEKSLSGWTKRKKFAAHLFSKFNAILAADDKTAKGLSGIIGAPVPVLGNLKYAGAPLSVDVGSLAAHRAQIGNRPVWCAASTHEGEHEISLAAHKVSLAENPRALLSLVPRHPERGATIARLIEREELSYTQTGYAEDVSDKTHIILIPKMGQLGLAYRLANVSLVGGSLLDGLSGHNPLEPARLGSAVLTGQYVDSFADVYRDLGAAGGLMAVRSAEGLAEAVLELWEDETRRDMQINAASGFTAAQDDVLDKVWQALDPYLPDEVIR